MSFSFPNLEHCASAIVEVGKHLDSKGWTPATSSNFSAKLDDNHCAITVSGKHKGRLTPEDIMVVDMEGNALNDQKPSAETLLHTQLYRFSEQVKAVLHTHSVNATLISLHWPSETLELSGYEILKAFPGIDTHDTSITVPIFDNTQVMPELETKVEAWLHQHPSTPGYLIRGHGLYTWGEDMFACERHVEALEFLLECTWKLNQTELSKLASYSAITH